MAARGSATDEKDRNLVSAPTAASPEPSPQAATAGGSEDSQFCAIPSVEAAAASADEKPHNSERDAACAGAGAAKEPEGNGVSEAAAAGPEAGGNIRAVASGGSTDDDGDDGYHTPTSPRHRIPPALRCPPAPRKPAPVPMRVLSRRRQRTTLDLDTKLLIARWWGEKLMRQMQPEDPAAAKRPRIRDV